MAGDSRIYLVLALLAAVPLVMLVGLRTKRDAVTVLTTLVVLLFGINGRYTVTGMGAIGTPAILVSMAAAWWWWVGRFTPAFGLDRDLNPVRVATLMYLWYILLNWSITHLRPLSELEVSGSSRALLTTAALTGIALLAMDGIESRARLEVLVRRLVAASVFLSAVGMVQFFTRFDPGSFVRFPGLSLNRQIMLVGTRSVFNRPFGTALHPIEFGVILAMALPFAIHLTMHSSTRKQRRNYGIATCVIAAGIPMSVSRSGVVAVVVALGLLSLAWTWRQRLSALILSVVFTGAMWGVIPGLIGTLRGLFVHAENDPSIIARRERVPLVMDQIAQAPVFGIGHGTFNPQEYFLLDNQYYGTTIETGLVGITVLVGLLFTAMVCARWVRRRAPDPAMAGLAQALLASIATVVVVMATFDAFAFRIFSGVTYLLIGCCGAAWRLTVRDRDRQEAPPVAPAPATERAAP